MDRPKLICTLSLLSILMLAMLLGVVSGQQAAVGAIINEDLSPQDVY